MGILSATIRGTAVNVQQETQPSWNDTIETRGVLTFTVIDGPGTAFYYRGDPVVLTDSVTGAIYRGYVQTDDPVKQSPDPTQTTILHAITCMDKQYLFDKRTNSVNYLNMYAGDIAADLAHRIGLVEGVTMSAAIDRDTAQTDWSAGTLTGTVATLNVGDGDIELTAAGAPVTITENTTATFATGTLTNVTAANNLLSAVTQSALLFSAELSVATPAPSSIVVPIWSGSMVVATNDTLYYDLWMSKSPQDTACVDLLFSDASTLSGTSLVDQSGMGAGPTTNLTNFATSAWYHRSISLATLSGKTINAVSLCYGGKSAGIYTGYFKNIYLGSQSGSKYFSPTATVPQINPPLATACVGYTPINASVSVVTTLDPGICTRVSTAYSISAVSLLRSAIISWNAVTPGGSLATIAASYDGGVSYQPCVNNAGLPALPAGSSMAGLTLTLQESFALTGDTPVMQPAFPAFTSVAVTLLSAAYATKSDVVTRFATSTEWNTGTYMGTILSGNNLTLGTYTRNWNDHAITNQTFYNAGLTATQSAASGAYVLAMPYPGGPWASSELNFLGQLLDMVIDLDITLSAGYATIGVMYRAANWGGSSPPEAGPGYEAYIYESEGGAVLGIGYGGITTAGGSEPPTVLAYTTFAFSTGTAYHMKIVVSGSQHTIFWNHSSTPTITVTDTTYPGLGNVGLWAHNSAPSGTCNATFDNLVCSPLTSGTWQSPSTSISALGTAEESVISWSTPNAANTLTSSIVVQTSINGGSTWQPCVNGGEIPGITNNTSVSGLSVLARILLASNSQTFISIVAGLVWRVVGLFPTVTGTRISPVLSLTPAGRISATSVAWTANLPANSSLVVATSPDNITYTTIAASGNPIAGYYAQPAPQIDAFTANTSSSYTSTSLSGGSTATWTYDTTNRRATATGGSGAVYYYTGISRADVDLLCDMDRSDAGGLVWRFVSSNNYYELGVYDDHSSGGYTNQLRLYKVASGTRSLLGSASIISFARSTSGVSPYHRIRVTMVGGLITVYFDGTVMQTYTDGSPLAAGVMGLRNDGGTSRYYQLRLQPLGDSVSGANLYTKVTLSTTDPAAMPQLLDLIASVRGPGIATGALIPQLHDPTKPFAEFLNKEMDTITSASGDYLWNIDGTGNLTFTERHATPAPWCLSSVDLVYDGSSGSNAVTPSSSADLYRNRQQITNCLGLTVALPPEQKITDGTATSWTLAYPVYNAPTITLNGVLQTVGVKGVDMGKAFYWQAGNNTISQDTGAVKLPAGLFLTITYIGQYATTVQADNAAEQTARALVETGTSGIVEAIEDGKGMLATLAATYAQGLLARYGNNGGIQLVATTQRQGLTSGMIVPVFLPEHGLMNRQMLVTIVNPTIQQKADGTILYLNKITATEGANLANWTNVFNF